MKNRAFSVLMASATIFGSMMVGCSGTGIDKPRLAAGDTPSLAPRVERLLADKDAGGALALAEKLVEGDPRNGDARALLGRAYLANGRYVSARTAFTDAMALGNRDSRTIVSLALAEAGLGDLENARQLLGDHVADLPAGDYGLAMAMTGDVREGVRALLEAAHAPDATAKTRQNLAYVLAMGGAWGQARLVAGQDLAARDAEARIGQWSQALMHGSETQRVIAMIGVAPRADDAGLPVQLALGKVEAPALASAADLIGDARAHVDAAPVDTPAPAGAAPTFAPSALAAALAKMPDVPGEAPAGTPSTPAISSAAVKVAFAPAPVTRTAGASATQSPALHTPQGLQAALGQPVGGKAAVAQSAGGAPALGAPAADAKASDWVIQLGAFDSQAIAREKWRRISAPGKPLKGFNAVHSTISANGQTFYRLAVRGFADRGAAVSACAALRGGGQSCFVRVDDTQTTRQARAEAQKQAGALAMERPAGRSKTAR